MDGRCLRGAALVVFAALAAAACGGTAGSSAAHTTPFAIGFELEPSGPFAANGKQIQDGWYLGLHDFGDTVAGRKIEATFVDEQGDPNVALTQARQLWQVDHVQMLEGPTAANAAAAVASFAGPTGSRWTTSLSAPASSWTATAATGTATPRPGAATSRRSSPPDGPTSRATGTSPRWAWTTPTVGRVSAASSPPSGSWAAPSTGRSGTRRARPTGAST